jgi:hypothetical protein
VRGILDVYPDASGMSCAMAKSEMVQPGQSAKRISPGNLMKKEQPI